MTTHGSKNPRIRAPPSSIVDGPNNTVADTGAQSGEALTVLSMSVCCMFLISISLMMVGPLQIGHVPVVPIGHGGVGCRVVGGGGDSGDSGG